MTGTGFIKESPSSRHSKNNTVQDGGGVVAERGGMEGQAHEQEVGLKSEVDRGARVELEELETKAGQKARAEPVGLNQNENQN